MLHEWPFAGKPLPFLSGAPKCPACGVVMSSGSLTVCRTSNFIGVFAPAWEDGSGRWDLFSDRPVVALGVGRMAPRMEGFRCDECRVVTFRY